MKHINYLLCLIFLLIPLAQATSAPVDERDIKAALIYNFSVYTTWPEPVGNTFNICTFEDDQENINDNLFASKKMNGKSIHFVIIRGVDEVKNCQVLYLQETRKIGDSKLLENLEKFSVLSIVDNDYQANSTSIIKIQLENKKYNFTINNQAAKQANLIMSSKLLRLAARVY